jgi:hypothetical protein
MEPPHCKIKMILTYFVIIADNSTRCMRKIIPLFFIFLSILFSACDENEEKCKEKYVHSWNAGGNDFFAVYDQKGRATQVYYANGTPPSLEFEFTYDAQDRLLKAEYASSVKEYFYDDADQEDSVRVFENDELQMIAEYKRDATGKIIRVNEYSKGFGLEELVLLVYREYEYEGNNASVERIYEASAESYPTLLHRITNRYAYDEHPLPFSATIFPFFSPLPPRVNNVTSQTQQEHWWGGLWSETFTTYKYNDLGYPLKTFNDDGGLMIEYSYSCDLRVAP